MQEESYQRLVSAAVKNVREAIEANYAKSELISMLGYELRTSLTSISGMAQLLAMDCLYPAQQSHATDILEVSESILFLINRLSNLSESLEMQPMESQTCSFNLKTLLEKVNNQLLFQAKSKGLQFFLDYSDNIAVDWVGNPDWIHRVVLQLSSYALKNTDQGFVAIQVECVTEDTVDKQTQTEVLIHIKDTGKGIEKTELLKLKACLEQADTDTRRYRAVNLGLMITLNYVRLLKATLEIKSNPGEGSVFICRIPLKRFVKESLEMNMLQQQKSLSAMPDLSKLRILLIEDNVMIQRVYSSMLDKIEIYSVDTASHAEMALEYYIRYRYDIILMDIALPDGDGMAITKIIRQQEAEGEHIPIIALTAYSRQADKEKFLAAGIDEVLIKPIKLGEITHLLKKWTPPTIGVS